MSKWFKPRRYKHFDAPVGFSFLKTIESEKFIETHDWSPHIHYKKQTKRYNKKKKKTPNKSRDIMYASHRDSCILSKYAHELNCLQEAIYLKEDLSRNVIGYRKLGKANYNFSADAQNFARAKAPCVILCFDISGFFDHLDHSLLKGRLKSLLGVSELPLAWHKVFRQVTRYRRVELDDLKANSKFGERFRSREHRLICTMEELKSEGIPIHLNPNTYGIPQGTPISAAFANLYLIELDRSMSAMTRELDALYQRYSDDIILICDAKDEVAITDRFLCEIANHKLEISHGKTERVVFDGTIGDSIQYLGFNISPDDAFIRSSSLSRQWRKLRRGIKRAKREGTAAIAAGQSKKIHTKKLRRRFSPIATRNFSSYARKSADVLSSKRIRTQIKRFEFIADRAIRELNPKPS